MYRLILFVHNEIMENIINFEDFNRKRKLTDEEIKSLFLGLVGLIKNNAIDDVSVQIKREYKESSIKLNNALLELKLKNEIIENLREENKNLKSKTTELIKKINTLKESIN